jgi:DNA invertase Pin-like site-specific DNA recombinase
MIWPHHTVCDCHLASGDSFARFRPSTLFTMAAEIERDLISQRTKEALAARKRSGKPVGRPKGSGKSKLDKHRDEIERLLTDGSTQKHIASPVALIRRRRI